MKLKVGGMKKLTRKELEDGLAQANLERDRYMIAMNDVISEAPEASEIAPHEGDEYVFRLFRSNSPSGGYVLVTYRHAGQRDYTSLHPAEHFFTEYGRRWHSDFWDSIHKLWNEHVQRQRNEVNP